MLDIGCGRTFPQVLLYNTIGFKSVGIDVEQFAWPGDMRLSDLFFYSCLERGLEKELNFSGIELHNIDITATPFPDAHFDLIVSNMVFEHIPDVPAAVHELHRIMKPGALTYIGIHLYPSLSGQHNPHIWGEEIDELPPDVKPWYHLRGLPGIVDESLNKWRESQYQQLFERYFNVLEYQHPDFEHGRKFLTTEILRDLQDYDEQELLRVWVNIVARKEPES